MVIWFARPGPAFIQFVSLTNQSADFLIYPGETIPGTGLPYWDKFVNTLLKSGNNLSHRLYTSVVARLDCMSSKWKIPHGLLKLVPAGFLIQWDVTWDLPDPA